MFELHGFPASLADTEKLYGAQVSSDEAQTMIGLSDLAITASPTALHLLARFLHETADDIQNGRLRNSHIHIGSVFPEWKEIGGGVDIQIVNTNYEGPALA
jgi:TRAP-type uncharacterized transport system substrate-binding protein